MNEETHSAKTLNYLPIWERAIHNLIVSKKMAIIQPFLRGLAYQMNLNPILIIQAIMKLDKSYVIDR